MDQDALATASALRRSLARLNRRLRLQSRATGLSATRHSILGQLYRDGPKNPRALARTEGVQPQSITRALAGLEKAGLAMRTQDASDRRRFCIAITAKGRKLIVQDAQSRARWLAFAIGSSLTALERDLLRLSIPLFDKLVETPEGD